MKKYMSKQRKTLETNPIPKNRETLDSCNVRKKNQNWYETKRIGSVKIPVTKQNIVLPTDTGLFVRAKPSSRIMTIKENKLVAATEKRWAPHGSIRSHVPNATIRVSLKVLCYCHWPFLKINNGKRVNKSNYQQRWWSHVRHIFHIYHGRITMNICRILNCRQAVPREHVLKSTRVPWYLVTFRHRISLWSESTLASIPLLVPYLMLVIWIYFPDGWSWSPQIARPGYY